MAQEKNALQPGTDVETGGLKIIGAGFGRTGTRSLKDALEILGFGPCYHMVELFEHPEHIAYWDAASKGELVNWKELFRGYQATVDWPGCTFYKELMSMYPDAKVLLSVRDPEKWYESAMSTIYSVGHSDRGPFVPLLLLLLKFMNPGVAAGRPMVNRLIWEGTFHGRFEEKGYAISVFNQHNEEVKSYVPPKKLLVYSVKEGWGPLCEFLGVPVPDVPFPHLNDRASFPPNQLRQEMRKRVLRGALIAAAVLALVFLRRLMRRGTR
ncbi:MAG TPA: sulfotransferase [Ktedonobacteraceae bacterium]|nr:sulfotransferase [Ktedonobacteraceae bacterium]